MPRPVRDRLVRSTIDLMTRHGVAGTGISELLVHSSASRRSVYLHFPDGKRELITAATEFAGAEIGTFIDQMGDRPAGDLVREFVALWSAQLTATDFSSGCPIVAATLGRQEAPEAADAAGRVFDQWIDSLTANFAGRGVDADTARTAATTVVAAIEGAVVISLARRSAEPLDRVGEQLARYVAMVCATPARPARTRTMRGSGTS